MKITRDKLKEIVRSAITEESEYQQFFKKALEKTGKSIPQMSDEEKKKFFNKIDAAWDAKGEKNEQVVESILTEHQQLLIEGFIKDLTTKIKKAARSQWTEFKDLPKLIKKYYNKEIMNVLNSRNFKYFWEIYTK